MDILQAGQKEVKRLKKGIGKPRERKELYGADLILQLTGSENLFWKDWKILQ